MKGIIKVYECNICGKFVKRLNRDNECKECAAVIEDADITILAADLLYNVKDELGVDPRD